MIKKLFSILKNYDTIMEMIDYYEENHTMPRKKKQYSVRNTPKSQLEAIEKLRKE